jgi:hypothetical protein
VALTERQQAILELERTAWMMDVPKPQVIRERFACTETAYYGELNELLELPEAMAYDPMVVRRLRRLRDRRRRARLDQPPETSGGTQP